MFVNLRTIAIFLFEYFLLISVCLLSWLLFIHSSRFNPLSKFFYVQDDYELYSIRAKQLENSSFKAADDLSEWLRKQNRTQTKLFHPFERNGTRFVCAAIMSKKRMESNVNYANQAAMAFLTRTPYKYERVVSFTVYNVEKNPGDNSDLLKLSRLVDIQNVSTQVDDTSQPRLKEIFDYSVILKSLYVNKCNYAILMEDDAILSYKWFESVSKALKQVRGKKNWLCIKLFSGYTLYDWTWRVYPSVILKIFFYASILFALKVYVLLFLLNFKKFVLRGYSYLGEFRQLYKSISYFSLFSLFVNSVGIFAWFNATSICPAGRGIRTYHTGFGAVALLLPSSILIQFSEYLNQTAYGYIDNKFSNFKPKDLLVDDFKIKNNLTEYIIEPSLVQHIGMHSSLYNRDTSQEGFKRMYKSLSFLDLFKPIQFDEQFVNS
jgi:hypothetical protein